MAYPNVRFATIGTNVITDAFLDGARSVQGFQWTAVFSRTAERAKEYAAKREGPDNSLLTFTTISDLASSPDVDAVYIASPTSEHAWQAIELMKGKKHVLLEKPACSHAVELEAVLSAAKENGVAFMEAMRPLKTPNFYKAKAKASELGPPALFMGSFCQLSSRWPAYLRGENPNAFLPDLSNGALMDLGCYGIYSALALMGPNPKRVSYTPMMLPTGVDAGGTLLLDYGDAVATIVFSKCSHGWNWSELQTENGTLRIDHLGDYSQVMCQSKGGEPVSLGEKGPGGLKNMQFEAESFVAMVQCGRVEDDVLTWELALAVARVLDRARDDAGIVFPADAGRPKAESASL